MFFLGKTLAFVSLVLGLGLGFFCVLGLGLEPCVFDSTSVTEIASPGDSKIKIFIFLQRLVYEQSPFKPLICFSVFWLGNLYNETNWSKHLHKGCSIRLPTNFLISSFSLPFSRFEAMSISSSGCKKKNANIAPPPPKKKCKTKKTAYAKRRGNHKKAQCLKSCNMVKI